MASSERFLVTGAMGCLGAWTIRLLLDQGAEVVAFDLSEDRRRLLLLADPSELEEIEFVQGDITDGDGAARLVRDRAVTHIVHLAALQVPFCRADPPLGALVNVLGTINVFEAVRSADTAVGLAYASSLAVFGPPDRYPDGIAPDDARPDPGTLYGVYKQANEGTGRVYAQDHGIGSVALRPAIVYGPGRDQGLTSGTTSAMLAAAARRRFHIPHGGRSIFQYAPDVAIAFIDAARAHPQGQALALNVGGSHASVAEVVRAIETAVPEAAGSITHDAGELPFPTGVDASGLDRLLGGVRRTSLEQGVAETVDAFRSLLERGMVTPPDAP